MKDSLDSAYFSELHKLVKIVVPTTKILLESFKGKIFSKPVSKSKGIANGFLRTVDSDMAGFGIVLFDTGSILFFRKIEWVVRRVSKLDWLV
jgi:hypothetical protein